MYSLNVFPICIGSTFHLTEKPGLGGRKCFKACLVSGAAVIGVLILPDAPSNVWALLLQGHHQGQGLVVKPCVYNIPIRQFTVTCPELYSPLLYVEHPSLI